MTGKKEKGIGWEEVIAMRTLHEDTMVLGAGGIAVTAEARPPKLLECKNGTTTIVRGKGKGDVEAHHQMIARQTTRNDGREDDEPVVHLDHGHDPNPLIIPCLSTTTATTTTTTTPKIPAVDASDPPQPPPPPPTL